MSTVDESGLVQQALQRPCPHGHGNMVRQQGHWALPQVARAPDAGLLLKGELRHTGVLFTVALYVCPTCKMVELADEDL